MAIKQKIKKGIMWALAFALIGCTTTKQSGKISAYYDSRGKPTATFTSGASGLPLGTKIFGFIDIETEDENRDNLKDPYMEIRLSKKVKNGLGAAVEHNRDFAFPKGTTRLGVIYEPDLSRLIDNAFVGIKYFPVSNNDKGSQLGLYGKKGFRDNDIYVEGFFDYNFEPKTIVSDIQVGKRINENLYLVVEGRYNEFKKEDEKGVAVGLEWQF